MRKGDPGVPRGPHWPWPDFLYPEWPRWPGLVRKGMVIALVVLSVLTVYFHGEWERARIDYNEFVRSLCAGVRDEMVVKRGNTAPVVSDSCDPRQLDYLEADHGGHLKGSR